MLDLTDVTHVDDYLSSGIFGSSEYLSKNTAILYRQLTRIIEKNLGVPIPLPTPHLPSSYNTVVRRELDFSFAELVEGKPISNQHRWDEIFENVPKSDKPSHFSVGPITFLGDWANDPMAESIRQAFCRSMLDEGASIRGIRPLRKHLDVVSRAVEIVSDIIPKTFFGTLSLAPNAVIVRGQVSSAYINENPNSFFVNETQLSDAALTIETLLHEALHEKMACIRLTSNLLVSGYDDLDSETRGDVLVPWPNRTEPRYWSFARALAAYHVYVHTSVLYVLFLRNERILSLLGEHELLNRYKTQFERANYLHNALQLDSCLAFADIDSIKFFEWTGRVIKSIQHESRLSLPLVQVWSPQEIRADESARIAA
jgi:hypothetical protein